MPKPRQSRSSKLDPYRTLRPGQTRVPNVVLNIGGSGTKAALRSATMLGLLIQFCVLVVLYLIGYTSYLEFGQQHATGPVLPISTFIFGLATGGTIAVSIGVLICSMVIDSSTIETNYVLSARARREGRGLLVFWIQKGGAINDQGFGSYAIFPRKRQHRFISSHPQNYLGVQDQKAYDEVAHAVTPLTPNIPPT